MQQTYSNNIWNILACPHCGSTLETAEQGATCIECKQLFDYTDSGALDLRLKSPKQVQLEFALESPLYPKSGFDFPPLPYNQATEVKFPSLSIPAGLTKELMSYFPKAKDKNSLVLDLGCGDTIHREVCEAAGFEYVGLDYATPEAMLLGDGHALPFKDNSFDFILSMAVIQYSRFPFVMIREIHRVLKPGHKFIGSVAFLEPYHDTFYHYTHMGTFNAIQYGGFNIEKIAPEKHWSGLVAQAEMGLFPNMPGLLSKSLIWPLETIHKLWWRLGGLINPKADEVTRIRNNTGSFAFIVSKETNHQ